MSAKITGNIAWFRSKQRQNELHNNIDSHAKFWHFYIVKILVSGSDSSRSQRCQVGLLVIRLRRGDAAPEAAEAPTFPLGEY